MRARGDRGAVLVDLVVGLALTTIAATTVALLLAGAARTVDDRDDRGGPVALALDQLTSDVRRADEVAVARSNRTGIWAIDLTNGIDDVRWEMRSGVLERTVGGRTARVVLDGLASSAPFMLFDDRSAEIDPADADAVRRCTRLVEVTLTREDGDWTRQLAVALRTDRGTEPC